MTKIIIAFLEAQSTQEVNNIVSENLEFFNENPRLFTFAKNARKRIYRVQKEMRKSWEIYQMN